MDEAMKIEGSRLTTCSVAPDGETLRLDLIDKSGDPISLSLPFDEAHSLTMTLPQLLTFALKVRTGDDTARYVFALAQWRLEAATDARFIITFTTPDGFEASFCLGLEECWQLARALKADAEWGPRDAKVSVN
jgi:hypothetical protein